MSYLDFDFPHTHFFESDLRELIKQVFIMNDLVTNFVSINAIKYADPIQWNITKSYEKNTVVIDGNSGVAYISVRPVPPGVALTREQYWTKVFDLSIFITKGSANFANTYESEPTTTATKPTAKDKWLVWDTTLYQALTNILPGDRYVPDGNIRRMTVEDFYDILMSIIDNEKSEREAGDDALELALNEETEIRGEADSALHQEIVQESIDRENADIALGDRIDAEIQNRADADDALGDRIDAEIQNRANADNALSDRIGAEIQDRADADDALYRYIDDSMANIKSLGNTVVLGNSYASGTGSQEGRGLFYFLSPLMKHGYLFSGSGTSFVDYDGYHQNDRFINHLNAAISSESFSNDSIDTILILGAYGESRAYISAGRSLIDTRTLLSPAIEQFATRARTAFVNLKNIIYVNCESRAKNMINSGGYMSFLNDTYMVDYVCYPLLIQNRIMSLGWAGIDAIYYSNLFSSDYYHPNTEGYRMIASSIINTFTGGRNDRHYRMDYSYDVSNLTGVSGSTLHGRHIMDAFRKDFNAQYITIPAGSYSLNTSYISINLNEEVVPPFNEPYGDTYMSPSTIQGQFFNWIYKFTLVPNVGFALQIRADRSLTGTSSSDLAVPFNFGIV